MSAELATKALVESGILGALVVILLFTCGYLLRALIKEKDKSLSIQREVLTVIQNFNEVQREIMGQRKNNDT